MNLETAPIHFLRKVFATFVVVGKNSPNMSHTKGHIHTGINLGKTGVTSCIEWFQFFIIDSVTVKASKSFSQFAPFRRDL